jgi:predicted ATP-dependent Lon-type protease
MSNIWEDIAKAAVSSLGKAAVQDTLPDSSIVSKVRNAAVGGMFGMILWKAFQACWNLGSQVTVIDPRTGQYLTFKNSNELEAWQKTLTSEEVTEVVRQMKKARDDEQFRWTMIR